MSSPALFGAKIDVGTVGTVTLDNTFDFKGFIPGQSLFFGFYYRGDRVSGTSVDTITAKIRWWDASNVELTATSFDVPIDASTSGYQFAEAPHVAPATATRGRIRFVGTPASGTFQHNIYFSAIRVAKTEAFAEVTRFVDGPAQSTIFKFDTGGSPETGEFPRNLIFQLKTGAGTILDGVTWTYRVLTGTFNGFTNSDGPQSMTGSGSGTLAASSLGAASAKIEVSANFSGRDYTSLVPITRQDASAPVSGGGGGGGGGVTTIATKTSGYSSINSTTFIDVSGAITAAPLPTGATSADINVTLNADPTSGGGGIWTVECKLMRDISGTPTQIGSVQDADSAWHREFELGELIDEYSDPASFSFTITDTGLTAGVSYTWRIYMRITSGTRTHYITGTVTVTA